MSEAASHPGNESLPPTRGNYTRPVIDLHFHWYPEEFIALMEEEAGSHGATVTRGANGEVRIRTPTSIGQGQGNSLRSDPSKTDVDVMIREMDEAGIGIEVVTQTNPHIIWAPPEFGARLARAINDGNSRLHQQYPERFIGSITLPMQDVELSLEELERARHLPGMRCVNVTENVLGKNLGDQSFWPIWRRCEALGLPLFLKNVDTISERLDDPGASQMNIVSNPFEATIAAVSLMLSGALDEFPNLEVYLPHAGGFFAFVAPRIEFAQGVMGGDRFRNMKKPATDYLRRFHYDLILHSPKLMRTLIDQVGVDRVACGTDRPQAMEIAKPIEYVEAIPGVTPGEAEMILCQNPARLLKL
jgi:aminocarboxymuconate-semialdehyde decarboxylase